MRKFLGEYSSQMFLRDFLASVVVFLVALPLCLGIAIASGVPPALGLIAGIIGGLVVGSLAGAPLQVSGPAAGLVSIVWEIVHTYGIESLGIIVLLAGIMQIAAGYFGLAPMFRAVSPAVVQGMLSGIGGIILASQFHVMVDDIPKSNAIQNILSIPQAIQKGIFPMDGTSHHIAALIGLLTITILVVWSVLPKRFHIVPAALVAVSVSVLVSAWYQFPIKYVDIPEQFFSELHIPTLDTLFLLGNGGIWIAAFTIAFVATAETILSTTALERMHSGPRAQFDKEIIAQGVGNTLSGFLGALPITGVIVRSTANIEAKAKSRLSAVLHGLWIGLLVLFFPNLLEFIPIASLAAVLVYTGYKLIQVKVIKSLLQVGKGEVIIYFVTLFGVMSTNLLEGVLMGFVLASFRLLYTLSKLNIDQQTNVDTKQIHLSLQGSATFISLPKLSVELEQLPTGWEVQVHIDELHYIDHACLELLTNYEKRYKKTGGRLKIQWDELTRKMRNSKTTSTKGDKEKLCNNLI